MNSTLIMRRSALSALLCLTIALPSSAETLLHYDFGDGSGDSVSDLSGNGRDGTVTGLADSAAGLGTFGVSEGWVAGGGLSFLDDATLSFVDTPLELNALGDGDGGTISHTIEFVASYANSQSWTPAIGSDVAPFSGDETFFFGVDSSNTQIHVRTPTGGSGNVGPQPWFSAVGSVVETTHHMAYVYDLENDVMETFIDGVSAGSRSPGDALDMTLAFDDVNFRIGNVGWNAGEQWGGVVQGVAISGAKLGSGSFALVDGNQPSTVLHYDFGDGSGDSVTDMSGQGNDGLLVDFVDTSAGAGAFNSTEGWVAGGGLSFLDDGDRSFVETPLAVNSLDDSFTIEFETNYTAPIGWAPVVGSDVDPFEGDSTVFAGINSDQTELHFRGPGWVSNIGEQPFQPDADGVLHHVVMRYDEETGVVETFVDGEALGEIDLPDSDYDSTTSVFRIANVGWAEVEQWAGIIRGVAISDEYLEPADFVLSIDSAVDVPTTCSLIASGELTDGDLDAALAAAGSLRGDADLNGKVEFADFLTLSASFGNTVGPGEHGWSLGDFGCNNTIDFADFLLLSANFGKSAAATNAAVPEPNAMTLALATILGLGSIRRRCRN